MMLIKIIMIINNEQKLYYILCLFCVAVFIFYNAKKINHRLTTWTEEHVMITQILLYVLCQPECQLYCLPETTSDML